MAVIGNTMAAISLSGAAGMHRELALFIISKLKDMKTLSMLCCVALTLLGLYTAIWLQNAAGVVMLIIGPCSFIIIASKKEYRAGYDRRHWMNR